MQAVSLDEVVQAGLEPQQQYVVQFETRSLRDARQLLASVSLPDAMQFIEQNPHTRCFWHLLSTAGCQLLIPVVRELIACLCHFA